MEWHVQYSSQGVEHVERYPTPEVAIEAACSLMDHGCNVYGIGTGPLADTIGRDEIARIFAMWSRTKYPFGDRRGV
jgi:hypothetical protein